MRAVAAAGKFLKTRTKLRDINENNELGKETPAEDKGGGGASSGSGGGGFSTVVNVDTESFGTDRPSSASAKQNAKLKMFAK